MKKKLAIVLALTALVILLALPAAAAEVDPPEGVKLYSTSFASIAQAAGTKEESQLFLYAKEHGTGLTQRPIDGSYTWNYSEYLSDRLMFLELPEGWEFDFDRDTIPASEDNQVRFYSMLWWDDFIPDKKTLGENVIALLPYEGSGLMHFCPTIIQTGTENTATLDIKLQADDHRLCFEHCYWDNYNPQRGLDLNPGDCEVIKLWDGMEWDTSRQDHANDVTTTATLVDNNLNPLSQDLATFTPSENDDEEGYYVLEVKSSFSGYLKKDDRYLRIDCSLPRVGYYRSNEANDDSFICWGLDLTPDNNVIYLIAQDLEAVKEYDLKYIDRPAWLTVKEETPGRVWKLTLDGTKLNGNERLHAEVNVGYYVDRPLDTDNADLSVNNCYDGLRARHYWGKGNYDDRRWQTESMALHDERTIVLFKTSNGGEKETPLSDEEIAALDYDHSYLSIERQENEDNGVVRIRLLKWTDDERVPLDIALDGQATCLKIFAELPEFGYYKADTVSKENYLDYWYYDGTAETQRIYFLANPAMQASLGWWRWDTDGSGINVISNSNSGICLELRPDRTPCDNLCIEYNGRSWDWDFDTRYANINIYDATSALAFRDVWDNHSSVNWDQWNSNLEIYIPADRLQSSLFPVSVELMFQPEHYEDWQSLTISDVTVADESIIKLHSEGDGNGFRWIDIVPQAFGETAITYTVGEGAEARTFSLPVKVSESIVVELNDAAAKQGGTVNIALTLQNDLTYSALAFEVEYDDHLFDFKSAASYTEVNTDEQLDAALEAGNTAFIYNKSTGRLVWVPSAANGQESVTAKAGTVLATLTFQIKSAEELDLLDESYYRTEMIDDKKIKHYNDSGIGIRLYRNDDWTGNYSYLADKEGNRTALPIEFRGGRVRILNHMPGDVNGDGNVNMQDVSAMLHWIVGDNVEIIEEALDINGDDRTNLWDVTYFLRYLAGWKGYALLN